MKDHNGSKRMMKPAIRLTEAEAFFFEWAGWSYNKAEGGPSQGRTRGAIDLAAAERWAEEQGYRVEWRPEEEPDTSWCDECGAADGGHERSWHEERMECAVLLDGEGEILDAVGNVDCPDSNTRRVVAAELALQAYRLNQWHAANRIRLIAREIAREQGE